MRVLSEGQAPGSRFTGVSLSVHSRCPRAASARRYLVSLIASDMEGVHTDLNEFGLEAMNAALNAGGAGNTTCAGSAQPPSCVLSRLDAGLSRAL